MQRQEMRAAGIDHGGRETPPQGILMCRYTTTAGGMQAIRNNDHLHLRPKASWLARDQDCLYLIEGGAAAPC